MTHQQLDILTQRVECLEGKVEQYRKTSRRWRTIGCCATAALVLLVLIGATDQGGKIQDEIQARRIVLVDPVTDKKRVELTGRPILYFYDEKENPVIALEGHANGPELTLARNKKSITMRVQEQAVSGGGKQDRLTLSLDGVQSSVKLTVLEAPMGNAPAEKAYSSSLLTLSRTEKIAQDKEMEKTIGLVVSPNKSTLSLTKGIDVSGSGPAVVKAQDQYVNTKDRAELELDDDGAGRLTLSDGEGRSRAVLGSTNLEQSRVETVEKRPTSSLVLFGKDSKVLWKAP